MDTVDRSLGWDVSTILDRYGYGYGYTGYTGYTGYKYWIGLVDAN